MRTRFAGALVVLAIALPAPPALAHEGDPNFRSELEGLVPATKGVEAEVVNYDDSLRLQNDSDETVVALGYEDEPYVRISPDGTVEVNRRSPAYYLNQDRYADAEVPASADAKAPPEWETVDQTGQYSWHDHRIHYMGEGIPPQVTDKGARTKVFDYAVPIDVGGGEAEIRGSLFWVGQEAGFPALPFVGLGVVALIAAGVFLVRHRRPDSTDAEAKEAW